MSASGKSRQDLPDEFFNESVISGVPAILPQPSKEEGNAQNSPKPVTPIVNKILSLAGGCHSSKTPESRTPSPLSDSTKKLRDLPHTITLRGCVAFVDVWSSDGTDNRSCVFRNFLTRMGATVVRKFTKEFAVTHVVFKDGHKSVLQKAQKRNVKLVKCLWVDRCRVLQKWVNEEDYLFDPTNYKPPKRFFEMQPQDPEDSVRRSAERLKRRKARFAKKNARIMFQSPLATHSCNGTPTRESDNPTNDATGLKKAILAADTPFHPTLPFLFFNPSIVYETPLSDSMQRKMQRLKEGKRVFSPPSSEEEEDRSDISPEKPTTDGDLAPSVEQPTEKPMFSPIPETQFFVKRSWRDSGLSPPKFDVSCDEIPETQPMDLDQCNNFDESTGLADRIPPLLPSGRHEQCNDETIHCNEDMELTAVGKAVSTHSQPSTEPTENAHNGISLAPNTPDSMSGLRLQISCDSTQSKNDTTVLESESSTIAANATELIRKETTTEQKPRMEKKLTRKKMRKLLQDQECLEPASILLSPQTTSKRDSVLLPDLGFSAYKAITQSGKFFNKLPSRVTSDCSMTSSCLPSPRSKRNFSQSTEFERFDSDTSSSGKVVLQSVPVSNNQLGLYDRIKMNRRQSSYACTNHNPEVKPTLTAKQRKRRRKSDGSDKSSSENDASCKRPKKKNTRSTAETKNQLFCSQAAISIYEGMKRRRSTMEFRSPSILNGCKTRRGAKAKSSSKQRVVVLTNLHSDERLDMHQCVRSLSGFRISSTVREHTTHVVCGAARRTLNVLRAISRGVWLLSKNWVTDSQSAGFWLEEESYEIPDLFPAARKNRGSRQRCSTWKNTLFTEAGLIYVADGTKPTTEDLQELIILCGGSTVGSPRRASLCVGRPGRIIPEMPVVHETWVLDCISENFLQPLDSYIIPS